MPQTEAGDAIAHIASGDPIDGTRALGELVALDDRGEDALLARKFEYPKTTQVARRWLRYVASRERTVAGRLVERMSDAARFDDSYAIAILFAGLSDTRSVINALREQISAYFKDGEPISSDYSPVGDRMVAWGYAGGSGSTLWHWVEDSDYGWEKLATSAFRGACRSFARVDANDSWALEQFVSHEWGERGLVKGLRKIENSPDAQISHRAVDAAELWLQAEDPFLLWRRGEVADVILRDWSRHEHWRVRHFGAQILASLGFQRTVSAAADWLAAESVKVVRESLLHALERAETEAGANLLLQHFAATGEGAANVARVAWRATDQPHALRLLLEVARGNDTTAAEAGVSAARLGQRLPDLDARLNSKDSYVRLNAALAAAYLAEKEAVKRLALMKREASTALERIAVAASAAMLEAPNAAAALHDELVTAASDSHFSNRIDMARVHVFLQQAVLDAFHACGPAAADLLQIWRDEFAPLPPNAEPLRPAIEDAVSSRHTAAASRATQAEVTVPPGNEPVDRETLQLVSELLFRLVVRLRERPEMLRSLDATAFWAAVRKVEPTASTLEDLKSLNTQLSGDANPSALWIAWMTNTRTTELSALLRHARIGQPS